MSKHTPGPWYAGEWGSVYGLTGTGQVAGISPRSNDCERIANTRLILAAPELLASLQLMVDRFLDTEGSYGAWENEALEVARAVIAKATGGEE